MRRIAAVLIINASLLAADPAVHTVGIGTRAFGMANNFTALANDFSALFWNPAGMAFVPVREVHFAMDVNRQETAAGLGGTTTSAWQKRYRVSSGGLLRSMPTTQGGFAFALGYSSPYLLDDLNYARGEDVYLGDSALVGDKDILVPGGTLNRDKFDYVTTGQCNLWSMGLGWQVAPGLGFGFSVGLLTGGENREIRFESYTSGNKLFEDAGIFIEREYIGYDARMGLLYTPVKSFSLGCRLELPRRAKVAENFQEIDYTASDSWSRTYFGTLKSGFSGAVGAALQTPYTTISADATFRAPIANSPDGGDGSYWKEGIGAGIEIPVKPLASVLRGGYSYTQLDFSPMRIVWDEDPGESPERFTSLRDRHLLTAGYSLLAGNSVSLEIAYGYQVWEFSSTVPDWQNAITEKHDLHRGAMSISIRY